MPAADEDQPLQWGLARSIRNAKMLQGELEEESMLERLESEVGKEKSQCQGSLQVYRQT